MQTVNHRLIDIALERVSAVDFENFFHAFVPALLGSAFVPLGKMHDGGADAFLDAGVFESRGKRADIFYQASIQLEHRKKIRDTVQRLRDFGRKPRSLYYFTSRVVRNMDQDEMSLSDEMDIKVKIRDGKWISGNINDSPQTVQAFESHLRPSISFLEGIGGTTTISRPPAISERALCVFLGQEIDRRRGKTELLNAVTDSLVLWALEDTDPDSNKFRLN